jgi:dihydroorotase
MGHLCEKFCKNPAEILKINGKGRIKEGYDGDIIIFNKNKSYYILPEKFVSKAKYSPYSGSEICGKLVYTIVKGEIVYSS